MSHASFAERLERIEQAQGLPLKRRMLVGISDEIDKPKTKSAKSEKAAGAGKPHGSKLLRLGAGFGLLYGGIQAAMNLEFIEAQIWSFEPLAEYTDFAMMGVQAALVVLALFLGVKFLLALGKIGSQRWRLPFVFGMALALGAVFMPADIVSLVMAQLG